jgi:hypothetical protein
MLKSELYFPDLVLNSMIFRAKKLVLSAWILTYNILYFNNFNILTIVRPKTPNRNDLLIA